MALVGCSRKELKLHIESLWQDGMNWKNYGKTGWHVDHIIPMHTFDMADPKQQAECFHYTNLRPLWMKENCGRPENVPNRKKV
jgi:hypothetical protein